MFKVIFWAFVIVILYRFLTRFVFPVAKMTKSASEHMRRMQQQMQDMQQQQASQQRPQAKPQRPIDGDYIEYEEVK